MVRVRRRFAVSMAIVLALGVTPALSGCVNVEGIVKNATGGNVDLGGNKVPSDFPSSVPLYKGDVVFGASVGTGNQKVWNVTIKVPSGSAYTDISKQLTDAGFVGEFSKAVGDSQTGTFKGSTYGVIVVVTSAGKNGWVANYTVAPVEAPSTSPSP